MCGRVGVGECGVAGQSKGLGREGGRGGFCEVRLGQQASGPDWVGAPESWCECQTFISSSLPL